MCVMGNPQPNSQLVFKQADIKIEFLILNNKVIKMGYIYIIDGPLNNPELNKSYIGYTTDTLERRWIKWKTVFRRYKEGKKIRDSRHLCKAVAEHGIDNFDIFEIEEYKNELLDEKEIYWIKELNTLWPNGYNIQAGGDNATASLETREILSQLAKKDISKDLPMYINYFSRTRNGIIRHGYKIAYTPSGKEKFVTVRGDKPITDDMLEQAKECLQTLIDNHNNPPEEYKLPEFLYNYKRTTNGKVHGYRVHHKPSGKSKYITTSINNPITNSMLEDAEEALERLILEFEEELNI